MNQQYQRPKKPLSRAQIAELKRKRRRERLIFRTFAFLLLLVVITVSVLVIRSLLYRDTGGDETEKPTPLTQDTTEDKEEVPDTTYINVPRSDIHQGRLVLVNRTYACPENYNEDLISASSRLTEAYDLNDDSLIVDSITLEALNEWLGTFHRLYPEYKLVLREAYRTRTAAKYL